MMHYIHNGHVRVLSYLSVVQFSMSETAPASRERLTILPQRSPFVKTFFQYFSKKNLLNWARIFEPDNTHPAWLVGRFFRLEIILISDYDF